MNMEAVAVRASWHPRGLRAPSAHSAILNKCLFSSQRGRRALRISSALQLTPAESARTLMEFSSEGTLFTLSSDRWPIGMHVQFTVDENGKPVFCLHPKVVHTRSLLLANSRSSLHAQVKQNFQKAQCILKGEISTGDKKQLGAIWERQFGGEWERQYGKDYLEELEFLTMNIEQVLQFQNLGELLQEEVWVSAADYAAAAADPLKEDAPRIVEYLNTHHWEDMERVCAVYGHLEDSQVEEARLNWIDRLGLDMKVVLSSPKRITDIRIPFGREAVDAKDARSLFATMAQAACERERSIIPRVTCSMPVALNPRFLYDRMLSVPVFHQRDPCSGCSGLQEDELRNRYPHKWQSMYDVRKFQQVYDRLAPKKGRRSCYGQLCELEHPMKDSKEEILLDEKLEEPLVPSGTWGVCLDPQVCIAAVQELGSMPRTQAFTVGLIPKQFYDRKAFRVLHCNNFDRIYLRRDFFLQAMVEETIQSEGSITLERWLELKKWTDDLAVIKYGVEVDLEAIGESSVVVFLAEGFGGREVLDELIKQGLDQLDPRHYRIDMEIPKPVAYETEGEQRMHGRPLASHCKLVLNRL